MRYMSTSHCRSNYFLSDLSRPARLQKAIEPRAKANLVHSPRWDSVVVDTHVLSHSQATSHTAPGTLSLCLVEGGPSTQNRVS